MQSTGKYAEAKDGWDLVGPLAFFHREKDEVSFLLSKFVGQDILSGFLMDTKLMPQNASFLFISNQWHMYKVTEEESALCQQYRRFVNRFPVFSAVIPEKKFSFTSRT